MWVGTSIRRFEPNIKASQVQNATFLYSIRSLRSFQIGLGTLLWGLLLNYCFPECMSGDFPKVKVRCCSAVIPRYSSLSTNKMPTIEGLTRVGAALRVDQIYLKFKECPMDENLFHFCNIVEDDIVSKVGGLRQKSAYI